MQRVRAWKRSRKVTLTVHRFGSVHGLASAPVESWNAWGLSVHFSDCFACYPDLPIQDFRSYLAGFPCLQEAEAARYESMFTEREIRDALKLVGYNKSSGLDGLPNEVCLRLQHMLRPILTDIHKHLFTQGAIPGSVTKGMITLLKKGGSEIWKDLDD